MPGFAELVLILFVILIIFGASKLPAIATSMGRAIERLRSEKSDDDGDPADDD